MRTEPLFYLRNKACLDPHAIINPYGKFVFWEKTWKKTETTIFVDWENLLADLRAIQKTPKQTSVLRSLILVSTTPSSFSTNPFVFGA